MGWNSEEWPIYLGYSALLVLAELAVIMTLRWRFLVVRKSMPVISIFIICGICTPMMIGLVFASGRSCMFPRQPGVSLMPKYGCCGQGLVFPQQRVVEDLLPLYQHTTDAHAAVDTYLEDYANANDELRWAITPVLIQHVGGKSSHDERLDDHFTNDMPFDFVFESNKPEQLAREHEAWGGRLRLNAEGFI